MVEQRQCALEDLVVLSKAAPDGTAHGLHHSLSNGRTTSGPTSKPTYPSPEPEGK
jgi:hypothetical protein